LKNIGEIGSFCRDRDENLKKSLKPPPGFEVRDWILELANPKSTCSLPPERNCDDPRCGRSISTPGVFPPVDAGNPYGKVS